MDSLDDLELEGNDTTRSKSSQGVRKNIPIKLKNGDGSTKSRGRNRKPARGSSRSSAKPKKENPVVTEKNEDDIMEGMEFSTMKVAGAEPMHKMQKLRWDHKVNLLGIKVIDPIIHTCETCNLPILIYGRMIPCKHVFCFDCAKKTEKICSRCGDPVNRVEQSALGAVFVCNYGGSKHGVSGCRRTYLSQRDLQAHINYRHLKQQSDQQSKQTSVSQTPAPAQSSSASTGSMTAPPSVQAGNYGLAHSAALMSPTVPIVQQPAAPTPASNLIQPQHDPSMLYQTPVRTDNIGHGLTSLQPPANPQIHQPLNSALSQGPGATPTPAPLPAQSVHMAPPPVSTPVDTYQNIPVMATRTSNLITVPIQDESDYSRHDASHYQAPAVSSAPGQYMPPTLPQPMLSNPPPARYTAVVSHQSPMPGYSAGSHQPPAQGLPAVSHPPPIINAPPMNLAGVNLSQPPPNAPMAMPPQPRPAGPPPPMLSNRYPNPANQTIFNQPPPTNARTWPAGPPPQTGHMAGPPGQMPPAPRIPSSSANMGPIQSRPFYH